MGAFGVFVETGKGGTRRERSGLHRTLVVEAYQAKEQVSSESNGRVSLVHRVRDERE